MTEPITIAQAIESYLYSISAARSPNTGKTYHYALKLFASLLVERHLDPEQTPTADLPEDAVAWFADHLKTYTSATEQLYLQAAKNFFEFLSAEGLAAPNLPRVTRLIRMRSRRPGVRLPQFPRQEIEQILEYAISLTTFPTESDSARLINLRDRALLLTLADTGLRVHEACQMVRGDVNWDEGKALVIGKGNRQAVVRLSRRALQAIKDYLAARAAVDGATGRPLRSLPIFARHDRGAGGKTKPISTVTARKIVEQRVKEALGAEAEGRITPHSFRHYFVTTVLLGSGNLKLAQALARHKNITVTQRYSHLSDDELDKGYWEVFEE